ncbi:hypothetical protein AB2M62_03870 [Sphingomonas sp. MMS12-HWE2-04]|uniref:hypothetical protein n=1 Tax=Sphingomonas sp. MMS12-HWE2-04 TaxID=3234199 RepID=UPI00384D13DE
MPGKTRVTDVIISCYAMSGIRDYRETEDAIYFGVPEPLIDPQSMAFRSHAGVLNDMAVSHRLSLAVGRHKFGMPEDSAFAIRRIEASAGRHGTAMAREIELHFEVTAKRYGAVTGLKTVLLIGGATGRAVTTTFDVIPSALATFVRRERKFLDFAEVAMGGTEPQLSIIAEGRFRYHPSEGDRVSDGRRVDHVPALTLIDIAMSVAENGSPGTAGPSLWAEFFSYTDPRISFDILTEAGSMIFVQNDKRVAIVGKDESGRRNSPG